MNKDRIDQLRKFLEEDPKDAFSRYALALEYLPVDKEQSRQLFKELLNLNPEYLAGYYHAAQLEVELQNREKAESIFKAGIDLAKKNRDRHALSELQSAYQNFLFGED